MEPDSGPARAGFNSSKSNRLPSLDRYFDGFYEIQRQAVEIVQGRDGKNKLLEDYLHLFSSIDTTAELPGMFTKGNFRERLEPLVRIAANNGFQYL